MFWSEQQICITKKPLKLCIIFLYANRPKCFELKSVFFFFFFFFFLGKAKCFFYDDNWCGNIS